MTEDTGTALFELIRPLFRKDALVQRGETDGALQISAAWRLGESRMDNWSREIRLIIPREVVERYCKLNEKGRFKANANLVSFVKLKLDGFRPEHDKPRYLLPPVEQWPVRFEDIFPR
jgi:hypothetical protein